MLTYPNSAGRCFSDAVLAHALILGNRLGILDDIAAGRVTLNDSHDARASSSGHLPDAVVRTLWASDAAEIDDETGAVSLTQFGKELYEERDIFTLWLDSYSDLLSASLRDRTLGASESGGVIKGDMVAVASADVGSRYLDEDVLALFRDLGPNGTLCDIGCGNARRLVRLCSEFGLRGLGIDISAGAVVAAEPNLTLARQSGLDVHVELGDATQLPSVYPDVRIVMQTFMTHHIVPDNFCEAVLRTYPLKFPNADYFLFFDTTTSEDKPTSQLFSPGFDYIHRLQGLRPRTRSEILSIFDGANLKLVREVALRVPNSFAWVLTARG